MARNIVDRKVKHRGVHYYHGIFILQNELVCLRYWSQLMHQYALSFFISVFTDLYFYWKELKFQENQF